MSTTALTALSETRPTTAREALRAAIDKLAPQLQLVLPKRVPVQRFTRIVFTQLQVNPKLAECSRESVLASVMKAAEQGLVPDGRQGHLVPYYNSGKGRFEAQFISGYLGLIDRAREAGAIRDIYPATVCEGDEWSYELGLHPDLRHKPRLDGERGRPIAVYAVATLPDGTRTFGPGPMTVDEVNRVRDRAKAKSDKSPWSTDWEAMAWKTVIRRTLKFCPLPGDLWSDLDEDDEPAIAMTLPDLPETEAAWPSSVIDEDTGEQRWYDSTGAQYDPSRHGWASKEGRPSVTAEGVFRARRGSAATSEQVRPDPVEPDEA